MLPRNRKAPWQCIGRRFRRIFRSAAVLLKRTQEFMEAQKNLPGSKYLALPSSDTKGMPLPTRSWRLSGSIIQQLIHQNFSVFLIIILFGLLKSMDTRRPKCLAIDSSIQPADPVMVVRSLGKSSAPTRKCISTRQLPEIDEGLDKTRDRINGALGLMGRRRPVL